MWFKVFGVLCTLSSSGALKTWAEIPDGVPVDIIDGVPMDPVDIIDGVPMDMIMTGADPRNYQCNVHSADLNIENLKDFARFFESGWGKSMVMGGDSLMSQLYQVTYCAGVILGYHTQQFGTYRMWRRPGDVLSNAFNISNADAFFTIADLKDLSAPESVSPSFERLFSPQYDLYIFNVGHYIYKEPTTFAKLAPVFFSGLKKHADATASHVVLMDHPPQHFNTEDGAFWTGALTVGDEAWLPGFNKTRVHDCSCKQPHMEQQHTKINNDLAAALARNHGFGYVSLWDDMNRCNEHPYDCTHFQLSPNNFKAAIRGLADVLSR